VAVALAGGGVDEVLGGRERLPRIRSFAVESAGPVSAFRSRPDLRPPTVTSTAGGAGRPGSVDPGFLFLGPGPVSLTGAEQFGPLIVDRRGGLVWFRPVAGGLEVTNFTRSRYRGEPVLMW